MLITVLAFVSLSAAAQEPAADEGRKLYAIGGSGSVRLFGNPASAAGFACRKCHGTFGEGGREGATVAPALTADALFAVNARRPALTVETFRRAVVEGIGPTGQELDPAMPRFELDARQIEGLLAYLRLIASAERQGVEPRAAYVGVLATPRSRDSAIAYSDRLRRALEKEGTIYGRHLGVRLVEALDAGAVAGAVRHTPALAIVGLSVADAQALPAIIGQDVPVLFPLFPLPDSKHSALVVALDADQRMLFGALADRMKDDGVRTVTVITDASSEGPIARVAADELASRGFSVLRWPVAEQPSETTAYLLVEPFELSFAAFAARRSGAKTRVYGIASQVVRTMSSFNASGLSYALAVDNMTAVRRAAEINSSVAEAHAETAATLISKAVTEAGRDLKRSAMIASFRRLSIAIASQTEAAPSRIQIIVR